MLHSPLLYFHFHFIVTFFTRQYYLMKIVETWKSVSFNKFYFFWETIYLNCKRKKCKHLETLQKEKLKSHSLHSYLLKIKKLCPNVMEVKCKVMQNDSNVNNYKSCTQHTHTHYIYNIIYISHRCFHANRSQPYSLRWLFIPKYS